MGPFLKEKARIALGDPGRKEDFAQNGMSSFRS
jgi:hypothetical protein